MRTLFAIFIFGGISTHACPFIDKRMMLSSLGSYTPFKVIEENPVKFPDELFLAYEYQLGPLDKKACKNAISKLIIKNAKSKKEYSALVTRKNVCDGGSTYGLIFPTKLISKKAIAVIQDDFIICL